MKYFGIKYEQLQQEYLSFVLPFEVVNHFSEILIYGQNIYGYQRAPIKKHVNNIRDFLLDKSRNRILPTPIILGANKATITPLLAAQNNTVEINLDIQKHDKLFRIIDGQHRLKGLEEACKQDPNLRLYNLNVIILLLTGEMRSTELEVFVDINSKGKRLKTDLILLAKHNYQVIEKKIDNLEKHIGIKTAHQLSRNFPENVWLNGVKFDVNLNSALGIVSVNAFIQSIENIVKKYITLYPISSELSKDEIIYYTDESAKEIATFLNEAWQIIQSRWEKCFSTNYATDEEDSLVRLYYDNNFYIQKTLGVKSLHDILNDSVQKFDFREQALMDFKSFIYKSRINSEDWRQGNIFSGLSSESGFKKAKGLILHYEPIQESSLFDYSSSND